MHENFSLPLLEVKNLNRNFKIGTHSVAVVKDITFKLYAGESLGIGGESGCGKSTLAKLLLQLIQPSSGSVKFAGIELLNMSSKELKPYRKNMQMIFQNPTHSFNPHFNVRKILSEPFLIHHLLHGSQLNEKITELLHLVGLDNQYLQKHVHELSGGQKQRIAIARALALQPKLIICDEPFSALDITSQLHIMQLLKNLQHAAAMTYLLISHDLSSLRALTQRIAIMYRGEIVEIGTSQQIFKHPLHPYTQALISAIPIADPQLERRRKPIILKEEIPSLTTCERGCPFRSRCPQAREICKITKPKLDEVANKHAVACHLIISNSHK